MMMAENKDAVTGENHAAPEGLSPSESDRSSSASEMGATDAQDASSEEAEARTSAPELPQGEMSFAEMFELAEKQQAEKRKKAKAAGQQQESSMRPGQVILAKVVGFSHDSVFLDVGGKAEGVIPKAELLDESGEVPLKEGDKLEARVRKIDGGTVVLTKVLPHQSLRNRDELREAHRSGIPIEGRVTGQNKGGYDVEIGGMRAFCPASQIDLRPGKPEEYVLRKYPFKIVEFKDGGRNIVVSRRLLLLDDQKKKAEETLKTLEVGKQVNGVVTSLKDYGAFVDLGGVEGLVHLSEITHGHLVKPADVLKVGQEVVASILKIEEKEEGQLKISLSLKSLAEDPWAKAQATIKEGQKVTGKVARLQAFGAFVEIMPGVDGLIHISNMSSGQRIKTPGDVVKQGEEIEATVISVDWDKKRIGLSLVKSAQELADELKGGAVYEGTVDRIESFGLFVKLPTGARGLVPAAETGTERGADLKKSFSPGDKVKVVLQEIDGKSGKLRLSIRAAREAEERAEYAGFLNTSSAPKGRGLGTLGDLFKNKLDELKR
jgi:small subunit ribosomal protein S1